MKKQFFSFVMMLALVIVASSAMALNEVSVYGGGLYHYKVNGISATTDATVSVSYIPSAGLGATVSAITPTAIVGAAGAVSVTFDVKYGTEALPSGDGKIVLTVTQGSCTNYVQLNITVTTPTWILTLTSDAPGNNYGCQKPLATPTTDGSADAYTGGTNTIVFTATEGVAPAGTPTLAYTIGVSGMSNTCASCGSQTAGGNFPVTFLSVEGGGGTVTGTLSGATFTMDAAHGGGTYPVTVNGPLNVTVSPLPTIGSFGL